MAGRLEVGAGVTINFHSDSDFDDARCSPSHDNSPWDWNLATNLWVDSIGCLFWIAVFVGGFRLRAERRAGFSLTAPRKSYLLHGP
jgi:hypothetical protein